MHHAKTFGIRNLALRPTSGLISGQWSGIGAAEGCRDESSKHEMAAHYLKLGQTCNRWDRGAGDVGPDTLHRTAAQAIKLFNIFWILRDTSLPPPADYGKPNINCNCNSHTKAALIADSRTASSAKSSSGWSSFSQVWPGQQDRQQDRTGQYSNDSNTG